MGAFCFAFSPNWANLLRSKRLHSGCVHFLGVVSLRGVFEHLHPYLIVSGFYQIPSSTCPIPFLFTHSISIVCLYLVNILCHMVCNPTWAAPQWLNTRSFALSSVGGTHGFTVWHVDWPGCPGNICRQVERWWMDNGIVCYVCIQSRQIWIGTARDSGWFVWYHHTCPTISIQSCLEAMPSFLIFAFVVSKSSGSGTCRAEYYPFKLVGNFPSKTHSPSCDWPEAEIS